MAVHVEIVQFSVEEVNFPSIIQINAERDGNLTDDSSQQSVGCVAVDPSFVNNDRHLSSQTFCTSACNLRYDSL